MIRSILAVLLGLFLTMVTVSAFEFVGHAVYPPPAGLDLSDPAAMRTIVAKMPLGAFLLLLLGWFVGTSAGAWVCLNPDKEVVDNRPSGFQNGTLSSTCRTVASALQRGATLTPAG